MWFRPRCPIDEDLSHWITQSLARLEELFPDRDPTQTRVVEPTPEFFPGTFRGTRDDATRFFGLVCGQMGLSERDFELSIVTEDDGPDLSVCGEDSWSKSGAAGMYEHEARPVIHLTESLCQDPLGLVATIAHELAHALLFARDPTLGDDPDHEPFTDLTTVFTGFGIFTANSVIREQNWQSYAQQGWSVQRQGYLDEPEVGFALASFAYRRSESNPPWARHLTTGVRGPFKRSLRFFRKLDRRATPT